MSTFNLTNTASQVDTAIQAVVGADTTPTNGSANMVTSDGVFDYVGTQLGDLAGKTVTVESTGIAATDNDTSIPTSAAVKAFVDGTTAVSTLSRASEYILQSETYTNVPSVSVNGSDITADGDGTYTIKAGVYAIEGSAELYASSSGDAQLRIAAGSGAFALDSTIEHGTSTYTQKTIDTQVLYFSSDTSLTLQFRDDTANATYSVRVRNISMNFLRIK